MYSGIFPFSFRHGAIYINKSSGVDLTKAKVYASAASPELKERKWQDVIEPALRNQWKPCVPVAQALRGEPFKVPAHLGA
jgi:hypothetical protein